MRKRVVFLGILGLLPLLAFLSIPSDYGLRVKCVRVIDGDTFIAKTFWQEFKVRLLYIDAPESGQGEAGEEASLALKDLIEGKEVVLLKRAKDFYGRTLAQVYLGEVDINLEMVKRGKVFIYRYAKFLNKEKRAFYLIAKTRAQMKNLGIYNKKVMEPYLFRKQKKGDTRPPDK